MDLGTIKLVPYSHGHACHGGSNSPVHSCSQLSRRSFLLIFDSWAMRECFFFFFFLHTLIYMYVFTHLSHTHLLVPCKECIIYNLM